MESLSNTISMVFQIGKKVVTHTLTHVYKYVEKKKKKKKQNKTKLKLWLMLSLTLAEKCNYFIYYSIYFCHYSCGSLYFLILFIGFTILFKLTLNFIYSTFNKKFYISE